MANIFNEDFRDFIQALNNHSVDYLLVGGYSVILHGYARTTGDLDLWVNRTADNYMKLVAAFDEFGLPVFDMTFNNFLDITKYDVFTFGRPPSSIEILTNLKGLTFDEAFANHILFKEENLQINLINYSDLIEAKKSAGRPRDLNDIEQLRKNDEHRTT
ncbi:MULTISPECIES: DUF6036 family nucleotidyltransferase [Emticicia]|uniref:DUF6036 family nucleotidyltransferase n=1 Tax=Emticicia TaxID=312278 RepID=UPI0020A0CF62|nr:MULTISPECIES: DUF6036 family nucleotidyltransferase [Emticicia]UTA68006.1 hypothetical protein MB380_20780 [Emticicia sp. 21SJ11W-3]